MPDHRPSPHVFAKWFRLRKEGGSQARALGLGLLVFVAVVDIAGVALLSQWAVRQTAAAVVSDQEQGQESGGEAPARAALFLDNDALMWLLLAQESAERGTWRLRSTAWDNAPHGREVHWSSGPIWFLRLAGSVWEKATGQGLKESLAAVAWWWNPFVHLGLVLVASAAVSKRLGTGAAILLGLSLTTLGSLHWTCQTGRPDHHGLQVLFVFLSFLLPCVAGLGWVRAGSGDSFFLPAGKARHWFIAAGLAGSAGLWVGAVVQSASYAAFGLGMAVWFWLERGKGEVGAKYDPVLWRFWGWSGAAGSLVFYLLEYFPASMGIHLEVNHPWYALCFAAGGECLCRLGQLAFERKTRKGSRPCSWRVWC